MRHHLLTFVIFLLAIAIYALGFAVSAGILILVGMAVELIAWYRLLRPKPNHSGNGIN